MNGLPLLERPRYCDLSGRCGCAPLTYGAFYTIGSGLFNVMTNVADVMIVLSSWLKLGILQWVRKSLVELAIMMTWVAGIQ